MTQKARKSILVSVIQHCLYRFVQVFTHNLMIATKENNELGVQYNGIGFETSKQF
jgi:hypothetical protein